MKSIKVLFAIIFAITSIQRSHAQTGKEVINDRTKKDSVKVYGACGMCKKRIEKAAMTVEGMESANWNEESKILKLKYYRFKPEVVDGAQKKIASVGHDTQKYTAEISVYETLPDCCQYQRKQ